MKLAQKGYFISWTENVYIAFLIFRSKFFSTKFAQKGSYASKAGQMNTIIEFGMFELV